MKIPKTVTILNIPYKVTLVKDIDEVNEDKSGPRLYGQCLHGNKEIRLWKTSNRPLMEKVFLHELMHAVFAEMAIRFNDEDKEEQIVEAATTGLYSCWGQIND